MSLASARDRIASQKEYVPPQQVMCVTFTSMSMSADIAGVRRSFVPTGCRSAVSAGASSDYCTSDKVLTLSIPSLPSHSSLPPFTHLPF